MSALCQIPVLLVPVCTRVCIRTHISERAYPRVDAYTRSTARSIGDGGGARRNCIGGTESSPRLSMPIRREVAMQLSVICRSLRVYETLIGTIFALISRYAYPLANLYGTPPVVFINVKRIFVICENVKNRSRMPLETPHSFFRLTFTNNI